MAKTSSVQGLDQLDALLEEYLVKKAPALPKGAKDAIVQFGPYIVLILLLLMLPVLLAALGIGALFMPVSYMGGVNAGLGYTVAMVTMVITLVLEVMALPGLFKRKLSAWRLMYYAALVGVVSNVIQGAFISGIVGALISLYILFQIKSYYK